MNQRNDFGKIGGVTSMNDNIKSVVFDQLFCFDTNAEDIFVLKLFALRIFEKTQESVLACENEIVINFIQLKFFVIDFYEITFDDRQIRVQQELLLVRKQFLC